ncbi:MAG: RDD family protein [Acidobacteria bacterium]|nr:RDD family protein [Acidobacteriota bacterium]
MQKQADPIRLSPSPKHIATKPVNTAEIVINKTNRTLMEFQSEQTKLPEWRLQLQNAVNQRSRTQAASGTGTSSMSSSMAGSISTATAVAVNRHSAPESMPEENKNPLIGDALRRIELSRQKFLIEEPEQFDNQRNPGLPTVKKEFPFTIAQKTDPEMKVKMAAAPGRVSLKPTLVPERIAIRDKYDTNELDPQYIEARVATSFEKQPGSGASPASKKTENSKKVTIKESDPEASAHEPEDIELVEVADDLTPFAVRFNSGLFDVIIGTFVSLILLSPFMLLGGSWFTFSGAIGFLATFAVVMFIYLTTTIGFFGKSFGMHLFSLEMIDIGGEEYPTFHQAAVSSSVFLLSFAFCGAGFLTALFDEDKRAIHDLVSGTIVVKEL